MDEDGVTMDEFVAIMQDHLPVEALGAASEVVEGATVAVATEEEVGSAGEASSSRHLRARVDSRFSGSDHDPSSPRSENDK